MPIYKKTITLCIDAITNDDSDAALEDILVNIVETNPEIYDIVYRGESIGGMADYIEETFESYDEDEESRILNDGDEPEEN